MPHVIVKLYTGKSEEQKSKLAEEITKAVMATTNAAEKAVSVSVEDVEPAEWAAKVYEPDIIGNWDRVYKKPGYDPR